METGQTESAIRVNLLESRSWVKKAKPRDEVYSFSLEMAGSRVAFLSCTTPTIWLQTTRLSMIPRPLPQLPILLNAWAPFSHSHPCARPHTSHTLLVTQSLTAWPDPVGQRLDATLGQLKKVRAGKWGIKAVLNVTEEIHVSQRGSAVRALDVR